MESEAAAFTRLAHHLHDQTTLKETLEKIVESAVAVVGCDYAGVLLTRKGNQLDACTANHPVAHKADKLQVELHEGPGFAAVADAQTTLVSDTAEDRRWPRWAAGMLNLHLESVLAVPLWTSQSTLGALNLYACSPRWFDPDALGVAKVIGRHASIALSSAKQQESLQKAIDSRTLIGQAEGILIAKHRYSADRAFRDLVKASQRSNRKLRDIAKEIVDSTIDHD
jgi:GAF domain-containing protein